MEERDVMEVDVLFVGGGVASLSGALHLTSLIKKHNAKCDEGGEGEKLEEIMIAVLEKGAYIGAHGISGAAFNPVALQELIPDFLEKGAPLEGKVTKEKVFFLTPSKKIALPITPPPLNNRGNYIVSMSRLNKWVGGLAEEAGVDIFPEFAGTEVIYDGDRVVGVRTGDKGIDVDGGQKSNYEPGIDLKATAVVFGEGSRGSLTKTLIKQLHLDEGKNPMGYEVGVKEVWEVPDGRIEPGEIIEMFGYPLKSDTFGGGFIYGMKNNHITLGLLTSLDYRDPCLDLHREFQKFKLHPFIAEILKDGKMVQFGAKTIPVSGYFSVPKVSFNGGMLIGDSAGLFNGMKIKGIHYAMKSGMLAAETIFEGLLKDDFSEEQFEKYREALDNSYINKELYKARNFHQSFEGGLWKGLFRVGIQYVFGGRDWASRLLSTPDFTHLKKVADYYGTDSPSDDQKGDIKYDGERSFDKETDVYYSGSTHEENQPPHLKVLDYDICYTKCREEYQNPCVRFCPANVYEMETDEETGKLELKLNFSNCVHCKTCDIKDPYENINWVPPEGGGGPKYSMV